MNKTWSPDNVIVLLALIWLMISAIFSVGYYHGDEHYQIIEFAHQKMTGFPTHKLAWEYGEQMRPALQPAIAYGVFSLLDSLSMEDPFQQAFVLRLLTAFLTVFAISFFANSVKQFIQPRLWRPFLIASFFLWFLPFINVRFSSETWSGLTLLLATGLVIRDQKSPSTLLLAGLLLGLSFAFRYQTAFATTGLVLWLLVIKKISFRQLITIVVGFAAVILLSLFIDSWFYESWVFPPFEYFRVNIIEGVASNFGESPWWYYFYYVFRYPFFPFGTLILTSFLFLLFKKPKSFVIWIIIPFLIVHSLISHKELRFLFPLLNFVPLLIFMAVQELNLSHKNFQQSLLIRLLVVALLIINLAGLIVASFKPAGSGSIALVKDLQEEQSGDKTKVVTMDSSNPYDPWGGLIARFYLSDSLDIQSVESVKELNKISAGTIDFLIARKSDLEKNGLKEFIESEGFIQKDQSVPKWTVPVLKIYGGFRKDNVMVLLERKTD